MLCLGSNHQRATIVQDIRCQVEGSHIVFDVANTSVTGAECRQNLQETQDFRYPILLENIASGNEHWLAEIIEHIQDVQWVIKAILMVVNHQYRFTFGRYTLSINNMQLSIIQMITGRTSPRD